MRRNFFYALALAPAILIGACKKSSTTNNNTPTNTTPTYSMSGKFGGNSITATSSLAGKTTLAGSTTVSLTGLFPYKSSTYALNLSIPNYNGHASYDSAVIITFVDQKDGTQTYTTGGGNGKIVMTSDDGTTLNGTFTGTVYKDYLNPPYSDSVVITGGSFNLKWQ